VCVLERDRGRVTRIRVQDQCAEEEYRERDSPCEVRLHLLTVAAAAAAAAAAVAVTVVTLQNMAIVFVIYEAEHSTLHTNSKRNASHPRPSDPFEQLQKNPIDGSVAARAHLHKKIIKRNGLCALLFRYQKLRHVTKGTP